MEQKQSFLSPSKTSEKLFYFITKGKKESQCIFYNDSKQLSKRVQTEIVCNVTKSHLGQGSEKIIIYCFVNQQKVKSPFNIMRTQPDYKQILLNLKEQNS